MFYVEQEDMGNLLFQKMILKYKLSLYTSQKNAINQSVISLVVLYIIVQNKDTEYTKRIAEANSIRQC